MNSRERSVPCPRYRCQCPGSPTQVSQGQTYPQLAEDQVTEKLCVRGTGCVFPHIKNALPREKTFYSSATEEGNILKLSCLNTKVCVGR